MIQIWGNGDFGRCVRVDFLGTNQDCSYFVFNFTIVALRRINVSQIKKVINVLYYIRQSMELGVEMEH
jgi:hypothetical protein